MGSNQLAFLILLNSIENSDFLKFQIEYEKQLFFIEHTVHNWQFDSHLIVIFIIN